MLACSALYNLTGPTARKALYQRFDHAAIFAMIAGSYTPFALVSIGGAWGLGLLVFVWTVAAAGILVAVLDVPRPEALLTGAYLLLGWTILVAIQPLVAAVSPTGSPSCSRAASSTAWAPSSITGAACPSRTRSGTASSSPPPPATMSRSCARLRSPDRPAREQAS